MSCNGNCGSCCGSCGGCARQLVITPKELAFLEELGQVAFLPVARKMGDLDPVYLEAGEEKREEYSLLLQCLEKKGLIDLSYDKPLGAAAEAAYAAYPIHGSISLTERGYNVLEFRKKIKRNEWGCVLHSDRMTCGAHKNIKKEKFWLTKRFFWVTMNPSFILIRL